MLQEMGGGWYSNQFSVGRASNAHGIGPRNNITAHAPKFGLRVKKDANTWAHFLGTTHGYKSLNAAWPSHEPNLH